MYSDLYAAWQREIDDAELQPLSADFYIRVADYVLKIKEETRMLDKKTVKATLLEKELLNVKRAIKQLTWMRYKKLIKLVNESRKLPLELLTTEETQLARGYLPLVENYRAFSKALLQGQTLKISMEKPVEKAHKRVTLRFLKATPAVIGRDMKTYGPFAPEDVASMPPENSKILVKQGFAIAVDIS